MKGSEPTARTIRREQSGETRGFLLLLLLIVAVVAVIQILLFVTITRIGTHGVGLHLQQVERAPHERQLRSGVT
jgi:hypothetical protein